MSQHDPFIDQLQDFLEYKKEEGFQTLEISPETLTALRPAPVAKHAPAPKVPAAARPSARPAPPAATPAPAKSTVNVTGKTLDEIAGQIRTCSACPLNASRKNTVPGEGNPNRPDILFIGDAPGPKEDAEGRFFVSEAGQLLDKMIIAMGYTRADVFITNIVKCRPPENRVPLTEEMIACTPYLKAQIALIQPKIIVALGKTAVEGLLDEKVAITRLRGTWKTYEGIDLMPTFHPGYLLKVPAKKREVWADLQAVLAKLGKEPPAKK
ncbi:MAG: uracil-DNA glycosylase [Verrucomicrobia bacterium]|nr:uracil-DNA glycosylase [Verrucomicrobiota bacterium]